MERNRKCETGCGRPASEDLYIEDIDVAFCIKHEHIYRAWTYQRLERLVNA